ncbi:MAG: hypothetical protein PHD06_11175 [Bacteroidales bacterium]|nr:hypothetical protein [Bacteroidales bacterium]
MKRLLIILIVIGLSSCATTSIVDVKRSKPDIPYTHIMVLTVTLSEELVTFDEAFYNQNIRRKFNNLDDLKFREHLEKSLKRNLKVEDDFPIIVSSSEVFTPIEDYSFDQFLAKYKELGCQALLLVNRSNYWTSERYVTNYYGDVASTSVEEEPNFTYLCYLLDEEHLGRNVWVGKITAYGSTLAGYDTLNNHMARRLSRVLRRNKYLW